MRPDVSVIMPAYQATATIVRAAQSVFAQAGVRAELVLCADDDLDYAALLPAELRGGMLTLCRTAKVRSGPSVARNVALVHARSDIIACLDADDTYGPDRLRLLLPAVEMYGVATGPTVEVDPRGGRPRIARPRRGGDRLPIEDICELRMPFPPVFHKRLGVAWPQIEFAEDVILNVDLFCAAGDYPFVEGADYIYHLGQTSRSQSPEALQQARAGYLQILDLVEARAWPETVRKLVRRVFQEDLANVERAQAAGDGASSWRQVVRDGSKA
jgi:glycosyltransferase involved in cell wall biosynthesis